MATSEFRYLLTNVWQPTYTVTNAVRNLTTVVYTATNSFAVGDIVTISGITPAQFNLTDVTISARTSSSFTIIQTITAGTYSSGGLAYKDNAVIAELPFTGVNFTQQLNSVGTFQGHVLLSGLNTTDLNAFDGTIPGKTILWVLYSDPVTLVSIPVWSGVIWAREYDSSAQVLSISAQEMLSLYNRRRISTTKTYSTFTDPAIIAYELMRYAEAETPHGKTGLTFNNATTGYSTKMQYNSYELKPVYQAVKDLAQRFFDFKIAPYWNPVSGALYNQFQIGTTITPGVPPAPEGGYLGTVYSETNPYAPVFQFPGNVVEYKFPEDASGAVNRLYGIGYGANDSQLQSTAIDPALIVSGATATWPLLEDTASYTDIPDADLLNALTLGQLNATSYPPTTLEIVIPPYVDPTFPTYQVGDEARIDIRDDFFPGGYNDVMRIVAISVNPGENGPSRITLTLTRQLAAGTVS
jgi:hypothetical protein